MKNETELFKSNHYVKSPLKAIRAKCLECCGGSWMVIQDCGVSKCYLYPFRFGKNPYRTKRKLSEEERAALGKRLQESKSKHRNSGDENG